MIFDFEVALMLTKLSLSICMAATIATVGLVLPGGYLLSKTPGEYLFFVLVLIGPYFLMGLLAWQNRTNRRASRALLVLIVLSAFVGLVLIGDEIVDYRTTVAA